MHKIASYVFCKLRLLYLLFTLRKRLIVGHGLFFRRMFLINASTPESLVSIGDNCFFNNGCSINCRQQIRIGSGTTFGEGVKIYDHNHNYRRVPIGDNVPPYICSPVTIGENCWIGSNVIILMGVNIGDNCVIGAGTVVTKSIPSGSLFFEEKQYRISSIGRVD